MQSPLTIAIDGNEANVSNRVGSNVYAFEIIKELEAQTRNRPDLNCVVLLSTAPVGDMPSQSNNWRYVVFGPQKLWTQFALPLHLYWHQKEYQVFFTPGHYAPRLSKVPYVSSVMDVAFLKFPDQFRKNDYLQLKDWTAYSVKRAEKVVAISEATKKDVVQVYGKDKKDVMVAYPALSHPEFTVSVQEEQEVLSKFNLEEPYLLYVGTLQPRKNLVKLVQAFESVKRWQQSQGLSGKKTNKKQLSKLKLVIAGKIGWLAEDVLAAVQNSPFTSDIILTNYVTELEKQVLYKHAEGVLLVGLYEGFGLPPLEAMSHGTIPIVANNSSLPEVVGKAGILVNADSVKDIAQGVRKLLTLTAKDKAILRKHMREQVLKFSWKVSATKILRLLELVGQKQ